MDFLRCDLFFVFYCCSFFFGLLVLLYIFIHGLFLGTASKSFVCYRTSLVLAQSQYDEASTSNKNRKEKQIRVKVHLFTPTVVLIN